MNYKMVVEIVFSCGLTINAMLFVPQALKLYKTKNTEGLSLITFFGFNCMQFLGALHSYFAQDFLPMWGWIVSLCTCGAVTAMICFYRIGIVGKTKVVGCV